MVLTDCKNWGHALLSRICSQYLGTLTFNINRKGKRLKNGVWCKMVTKYHFLRVIFSRAFIIDDINTLMISQFVKHREDFQ